MSAQRLVRVASPAKVNLGLEILGKRADGYHEIRSVLAMVDLRDDLTFTQVGNDGPSTISGMPQVPDKANLILKAIDAFNRDTGADTAWQVDVTKRIPAPAGLGGASSNAACTLLALNHLTGTSLDHNRLMTIAAKLGSDVPFFLGSPAAIVSGTGTDLTPLPAPRGWVLIAAPRLDIEAKTARLYDMLGPADFSDGHRARAVAEAISLGAPPAPGALPNAFARPLAALVPSIGILREDMRSAGMPYPLLTGAGPAHYALFMNERAAREARKRLARITRLDLTLHIARFRDKPVVVADPAP